MFPRTNKQQANHKQINFLATAGGRFYPKWRKDFFDQYFQSNILHCIFQTLRVRISFFGDWLFRDAFDRFAIQSYLILRHGPETAHPCTTVLVVIIAPAFSPSSLRIEMSSFTN